MISAFSSGDWDHFLKESTKYKAFTNSNSLTQEETTILDNSNEKLGPPLPPISMMRKWARFGFCGDSSLIQGEGGGLISLFILSKIVVTKGSNVSLSRENANGSRSTLNAVE